MITLATVKTVKEAAERLRLLRQAVDAPTRIRTFARGNWFDDRNVPVFAPAQGLEVTATTGRRFMTAIVDGEPAQLCASPIPRDLDSEEIVICFD
jgi:hypothetical protein